MAAPERQIPQFVMLECHRLRSTSISCNISLETPFHDLGVDIGEISAHRLTVSSQLLIYLVWSLS